jgi:hypothetical protein
MARHHNYDFSSHRFFGHFVIGVWVILNNNEMLTFAKKDLVYNRLAAYHFGRLGICGSSRRAYCLRMDDQTCMDYNQKPLKVIRYQKSNF